MFEYTDLPSDPKRRIITKNILAYFRNVKRIEPISYLKSILERIKATKRHKILQKSMSKIDKQLDLIRFMRNMRMQTAAIIGLLNTN